MVAQVEPATRMQLPQIPLQPTTTTTNQPTMRHARNQERHVNKYTEDEIRIARTLIESEGPDPEYLSIAESVSDLDLALTREEEDAMCERISDLIRGAVTTITFNLGD